MRAASRAGAVVATALATLLMVLASAVPARADQVRSLEYWLDEYGIRDAWATTRGAGVTVAVIDTGVDGSVPDLAGAVVGGTDFSGAGAPDGQQPVGDEPGHGTWVASLLAGRGTGLGRGLLGVAPEASVLSISVSLGSGGTGAGTSSDDQIASAVRWAVDHGADVINMSFTRNTLGWPRSWDAAFRYAFDHDVVVVAAAGNRGSGTEEVGAPATIPGVLAVAGVDRAGHASIDASSQGITLGVAAPSEGLLGAEPSGGYVRWSGTSGAAPIVSGAVALVRAAHPDLDAANVLNRIIATAHPVGHAPNPTYGYGLLDAAAAVSADVPSVDANPLGDLDAWIRLHRRAESTDPAAPEPSRPPSSATPLPADASIGLGDLVAPRWGLTTGIAIPGALATLVLTLLAVGVVLGLRHFRRTGRRE